MTQPGAPSVADGDRRNSGVTNPFEVAAYIIAQSIKLGLIYTLSFLGLLSPLYLWAMQAGGRMALYEVSIGLSVAWGAMTLLIFFAARALLGGVPANMPRGGEIGVFALAYAVVIGAQLVLNALVLNRMYVALGQLFAPMLGLGLSIVFAAIVFGVFLGLRRLIRGERTA
jgi:hypothetical protein